MANHNPHRWISWMLFWVLLAQMFLAPRLGSRAPRQELPYSAFLQKAANSEIAEVQVSGRVRQVVPARQVRDRSLLERHR